MSDRDIGIVSEFKDGMEENVKFLAQHLDLVSDQKFARSLVSWHQKYGTLSEKQIFRAAQFWQEVNQQVGVSTDSTTTAGVGTPLVGSSTVINKTYFNIIQLFDKAAGNIKYPSVRFPFLQEEALTFGAKGIKFYRTGTQSRKPGDVSISLSKELINPEDNWKAWVGLIDRISGKLEWKSAAASSPELRKLVEHLLDNFEKEAVIRGQKYNHCCFCGLELNNAESVRRGYGPICAGNYGLPWGESEEVELGNITLEDL